MYTGMEQNTLWLPEGFGKGTIIYDLDNNPYEAGERIMDGLTNIRKITAVPKDYAEARIAQGADKMVSTKN